MDVVDALGEYYIVFHVIAKTYYRALNGIVEKTEEERSDNIISEVKDTRVASDNNDNDFIDFFGDVEFKNEELQLQLIEEEMSR